MIDGSDAYVAFDHVKFEPSSWQHRNRIKGPNGPFFLSVPIMKEMRGNRSICDCRIDYREPWAGKHIKSLELTYRKAPWFERYFPELKAVMEGGFEGIADLNIAVIDLLLRFLGIERKLIRSSGLPLGRDEGMGKNERLIHLMKTIGATHFYEGSSGRNFVDSEKFQMEGLTVTFQEYRHPVYPQQWGGFIPYMSVVDLLFNCGEKSLGILRRGVQPPEKSL